MGRTPGPRPDGESPPTGSLPPVATPAGSQAFGVALAGADDHYARGQLPEALVAYRQLAAEYPPTAHVHSRIGAILAQQGDLDGARQALLYALELDIRCAPAHSNLGNVYYSQGRYGEALTSYQEATRLEPDTPVYYTNQHAAHRKLGQISAAVAALKRAQALERARTTAADRSRWRQVRRQAGCVLPLLPILLILLALTALALGQAALPDITYGGAVTPGPAASAPVAPLTMRAMAAWD